MAITQSISFHGFIEFSEADDTIFFQIGHRTLSVRELIGQFPTYDAIIPREAMDSIVFGAADFMGCTGDKHSDHPFAFLVRCPIL